MLCVTTWYNKSSAPTKNTMALSRSAALARETANRRCVPTPGKKRAKKLCGDDSEPPAERSCGAAAARILFARGSQGTEVGAGGPNHLLCDQGRDRVHERN